MQMAQLIVFEPDLLFSSRIESAAAKVGFPVKVFDNLDEFLQEAKQSTPQVALVNLDAAGGKFADLESLARSLSCRVVGYYSHVNSSVAEEAQRIGVSAVFTRGAFVNKLEALLRGFSSG
jgi:ActR/RegA family two-component response regulator